MANKSKDLQPWLDYFQMLQIYERKGYFEVQPEKREAYMTLPALHAMSEGSDIFSQLKDGAIKETVNRIYVYAAWRSLEGRKYMDKNFALHIVKPESPHDLLCTLLITKRRRWWKLWKKCSCIETIMYLDYDRRKILQSQQ